MLCLFSYRYHWEEVKDVCGGYRPEPVATQSSGKQKTQQTIDWMVTKHKPMDKNSPQYQSISTAIAEYIVVDLKPLSTVEGKGFLNLINVLQPKYPVPCRSTILEKYIVPMYHNTRQKVKSEISEAQSTSITTDGWTSIATEGYITTTAHFIDSDDNLQARVLDTKKSFESHTAENLAADMKNTLKLWDIKEKDLAAAVHDNARNITKACDLCGIEHIGCCAHSINLIVSRCTSVPEVTSLINKCRKIVAAFKMSDNKTLALADAEKRLALKVCMCKFM